MRRPRSNRCFGILRYSRSAISGMIGRRAQRRKSGFAMSRRSTILRQTNAESREASAVLMIARQLRGLKTA